MEIFFLDLGTKMIESVIKEKVHAEDVITIDKTTASKNLQKSANHLLKFVMDETIGADIETFKTHFNRGLFTFFKKAELNGFVQFQRLIIEIYF